MVEGYPAGTPPNEAFNQAGAAYFPTFGIPLIAGRDFTREDAANRPKVAVVNEAFAEKYNKRLDVKMRVKALGSIDVLAMFGNSLREPYSKVMEKGWDVNLFVDNLLSNSIQVGRGGNGGNGGQSGGDSNRGIGGSGGDGGSALRINTTLAVSLKPLASDGGIGVDLPAYINPASSGTSGRSILV